MIQYDIDPDDLAVAIEQTVERKWYLISYRWTLRRHPHFEHRYIDLLMPSSTTISPLIWLSQKSGD